MGNYKKHLYSLSSWLIIGLILYLWVKFIYSDTASQNVKIKSLNATQSTVQPVLNSGSVSQFHLFGSSQKTSQKSTAHNKSSLNLTLSGTMSLPNNKEGFAFIADSQGTQKKFNVGDKVFNLAKLKEIHKNHVILNNNGKDEKLSLPESSKIVRTVNKSQAQSKKPAYLKHLNGVEQRSWQEMMAQQKFDSNKISSIVGNMNMVMDNAGDINGIRVSNLAAGSLLSSNGLKSNDIITAINGNNVSSKNLLTIQETLQKDPNAIITIKRNGRIQNIKIDLRNL